MRVPVLPMKQVVRLVLAVALGLPLTGNASDFSAVDAAAERIASRLRDSGKVKAALLDFTDLDGRTTELGRYLSSELATGLSNRGGGVQLLDRANIRRILQEHKLQERGLVEPGNIVKLGRFTAVQALGIGRVVALGESYRITVQFTATDTAAIVATERIELPVTPALRELERRTVDDSRALSTTPDAVSPGAFVERSGSGDGNGFTITLKEVSRLPNGQAAFHIIHRSVNRTYSVALLEAKTYLVDDAGNQHRLIRATNISTIDDRDLAAGTFDAKEFPGGIGIRYSLTFETPRQLSDASIVVTYIESRRNERPKPIDATLKGVALP